MWTRRRDIRQECKTLAGVFGTRARQHLGWGRKYVEVGALAELAGTFAIVAQGESRRCPSCGHNLMTHKAEELDICAFQLLQAHAINVCRAVLPAMRQSASRGRRHLA